MFADRVIREVIPTPWQLDATGLHYNVLCFPEMDLSPQAAAALLDPEADPDATSQAEAEMYEFWFGRFPESLRKYLPEHVQRSLGQ